MVASININGSIFIKHILISVGSPGLLFKEVIENPKSIKKLKLYQTFMFRSGITK